MASILHPRSGTGSKSLSPEIRERIKAALLLNRLQEFALDNPDKPTAIRMTRTQVHVALSLLKKIIPDLASVEVSGNPEKPLMVQVVRFSDGEEISQPRPVLDMGRLIEMDREETLAIEHEVKAAATRKKGSEGG